MEHVVDSRPNWRVWLDRFQRSLGGNRFATRVALKVRNQTQSIIGHALGDEVEVTDKCNSEGWLIRQFARTSKVFVDVGANRGDWTAQWLRETELPARGLLFEPVAELAQALKERFHEHSGIEVINVAVSDQTGHRDFFIPPDARRSSLARGASLPGARKTEVTVTTLDSAATEAGLDGIDFVKIDAEGYDLNVVKGGQKLLAGRRIKLLQFEYGGTWVHANNTLATALELLRAYDYSTYLLRKNGLYRFDYHKYGDYFSYSNFVAVSPDLGNRVTPLIRGEI